MWKVLSRILGPAPENRLEHSPSAAGMTLIALGLSTSDRAVLTESCLRYSWPVCFADTIRDAWNASERSRLPIVLCDRTLRGTDWKDAIRALSSPGKRVYSILVSRVIDGNLWDEVIRLGGYEVVPTPLHEEAVLRSVRLALLDWRSSAPIRASLLKS